MHNKLQQFIREIIEEELDEMTGTAAVAGYDTPKAFSGAASKPIRRKLAQVAGYTLADKDVEEGGKIDEGRSRYQQYKMDDGTPVQKIGRAITEINKQLYDIENVLRMNARLKKESNLEGSGLWKRTIRNLTQLEDKLLSISDKIRELKS